MEAETLQDLMTRRKRNFAKFLAESLPDSQLKSSLLYFTGLDNNQFINLIRSGIYHERDDLPAALAKLATQYQVDIADIPDEVKTKCVRYLEFFCLVISELEA